MHFLQGLLFVLAAVSAACSKKSEGETGGGTAPPPTPTATAGNNAPGGATAPPAGGGNARIEARSKFNQVCAQCHGASGKGDGPAAAALNPKPRDYSDAAWQKTVTDAQLTEIILKGGASVGKSPSMPPNPDLEAKPEVTAELVKIVRSFAPAE